MKKKITAALMALILVLGLLPAGIFAADLPEAIPFSPSIGNITDFTENGYTYYGAEYAPTDPNADSWGYIYPQCSVDLYTVSIPYGTETMVLDFGSDLRIAYGYDRNGTYCIFGALSALVVYGGIVNPAPAMIWSDTLNTEILLSNYISGFPMDCVQGVATAVFLWFGAKPLLEKLERIKEKYGILQHSVNIQN